MHPKRKLILYRWIVGICLVLAGVSWTYCTQESPKGPLLKNRKDYSVKKMNMPSKQARETIRQAVLLLQRKKNTAEIISSLDPGLLSLKKQRKDPESLPGKNLKRPQINLILQSKEENLAILNGQVYQEGERLPDGRQLLAVHPRGVVLKSGDEQVIVPWKRPIQTLLEEEG